MTADAWWEVLVTGALDARVAFAPDQFGEVLQWSLDTTTYGDALPSGVQTLEDRTGRTDVPRAGRVVAFDGTDDFTWTGNNFASPLSLSYPLTVTCKFKASDVAGSSGGLMVFYHPTGNSLFNLLSGGGIQVRLSTSAGFSFFDLTSVDLLDGAWHTLTVQLSSTASASVWIDDGAEQVLTVSPTAGAFENINRISVGSSSYEGRIADVRIYSGSVDDAEAALIHAGSLLPARVPVVAYWMNEEDGTELYNSGSAGTAWNLDVYNATLSLFHVQDDDLGFNVANTIGYSFSGDTIIPRDEADTANDVLGNPLAVAAGSVGFPMTIQTPCYVADGLNHSFIMLKTIVDPVRVDFWMRRKAAYTTVTTAFSLVAEPGLFPYMTCNMASGGRINSGFRKNAATSVVVNTPNGALPEADSAWHKITLLLDGGYINGAVWRVYVDDVLSVSSVPFDASNGGGGMSTTRITVGNGQTGLAKEPCEVSDIRITDASGKVTYVPLQDAGESRDVSWVDSAGDGGVITGVITGGVDGEHWAAYVPEEIESWALNYGGGKTAIQFLPGRIGSSLDAAGDAKTIQVGEPSPFDVINQDPYHAADLQPLGVPTDWPQMPCFAGNGTDRGIYVGELTNVTVIEFWLWCPAGVTSGNMCGIRSGIPILAPGRSSVGRLTLTFRTTDGYAFSTSSLNAVPDETWVKARFEMTYEKAVDGGGWRMYVNDVLEREMSEDQADGVTGHFWLFTSGLSATAATGYFACRMANFYLETEAGDSWFFPLNEGSGRDITKWVGNEATSMVDAVKGTITGAWDNQTARPFSSPDYRCLPTLAPAGTKFANDRGAKRLTFREPFTGDDLDAALRYVNE